MFLEKVPLGKRRLLLPWANTDILYVVLWFTEPWHFWGLTVAISVYGIPWNAGLQVWFANSHKDLSLLSSGSTVTLRVILTESRNQSPAWKKYDVTKWCTQVPGFAPLSPSYPIVNLKCLYSSDYQYVRLKKKSQNQNPTGFHLFFYLILYLLGEKRHPICHFKFSPPVCQTINIVFTKASL